MSVKEEEDRKSSDYIEPFDGTRKGFRSFNINFEAWARSKGIGKAYYKDRGTDLWTENKYYEGKR